MDGMGYMIHLWYFLPTQKVDFLGLLKVPIPFQGPAPKKHIPAGFAINHHLKQTLKNRRNKPTSPRDNDKRYLSIFRGCLIFPWQQAGSYQSMSSRFSGPQVSQVQEHVFVCWIHPYTCHLLYGWSTTNCSTTYRNIPENTRVLISEPSMGLVYFPSVDDKSKPNVGKYSINGWYIWYGILWRLTVYTANSPWFYLGEPPEVGGPVLIPHHWDHPNEMVWTSVQSIFGILGLQYSLPVMGESRFAINHHLKKKTEKMGGLPTSPRDNWQHLSIFRGPNFPMATSRFLWWTPRIGCVRNPLLFKPHASWGEFGVLDSVVFLGGIPPIWRCEVKKPLGNYHGFLLGGPSWLYNSKKSPTGPSERTPKPEYLITLVTSLGVCW